MPHVAILLIHPLPFSPAGCRSPKAPFGLKGVTATVIAWLFGMPRNRRTTGHVRPDALSPQIEPRRGRDEDPPSARNGEVGSRIMF